MSKIAVCPGSFDPITNGHLDVIQRASGIFDKVIVVVMFNYKKRNSAAFTPEERVDLIHRSTADIPNVEVEFYDGLLADYVEKKGACAIVKGLRAVTDFEDEFQQALINKRLAPGVETIFIASSSENMFLSSSIIKQICGLGADISPFVPTEIFEDLKARLKPERID
ncbi:MAG TPA: pantetheine-phosphate adenylyltransferase [Clostridiales bacterium]|nr:pantetheine-phosphate adenylyltransferase [Clostridiales bacterium]